MLQWPLGTTGPLVYRESVYRYTIKEAADAAPLDALVAWERLVADDTAFEFEGLGETLAVLPTRAKGPQNVGGRPGPAPAAGSDSAPPSARGQAAARTLLAEQMQRATTPDRR